MKDLKIGDHLIGERHPPLVIAEMSGNHNQSLDVALELVNQAANCLLYTSPSPRDGLLSRMPSSA